MELTIKLIDLSRKNFPTVSRTVLIDTKRQLIAFVVLWKKINPRKLTGSMHSRARNLFMCSLNPSLRLGSERASSCRVMGNWNRKKDLFMISMAAKHQISTSPRSCHENNFSARHLSANILKFSALSLAVRYIPVHITMSKRRIWDNCVDKSNAIMGWPCDIGFCFTYKKKYT